MNKNIFFHDTYLDIISESLTIKYSELRQGNVLTVSDTTALNKIPSIYTIHINTCYLSSCFQMNFLKQFIKGTVAHA